MKLQRCQRALGVARLTASPNVNEHQSALLGAYGMFTTGILGTWRVNKEPLTLRT